MEDCGPRPPAKEGKGGGWRGGGGGEGSLEEGG